MKLTKDNVKRGLRIIRTQHPEWGKWTVTAQVQGVPGMWEIRGESGERLLDSGEFESWHLADS